MPLKLFEIPVYALSKADLEKRVKQEYDKVRIDYEACGRSGEHGNRALPDDQDSELRADHRRISQNGSGLQEPRGRGSEAGV